MAWLTVLVAVIVALEGTNAFHKFHKINFDHGKHDLNLLKKHYMNKVKNVVHMDQPSRAFNLKMNWKNCGSANAPAMIRNLTITPDPIRVPGDLHLAASVSVKKDITAPLKAEVEMKKSLFGDWVRIPCWKGKVGSCTYGDVCRLINPTKPCPDPLPKYKIPCHCPFPKGDFYLPFSTFVLKSPGNIPHWVGDGDYEIQVKLFKGATEMGCFFLKLTLHF